MTVAAVRTDGVLHLVTKACAEDPDAGLTLLTLAWYEAIGELVDDAQVDIAKAVAEDSAVLRRALVRTYVAKRAAGEDVTELLAQAAELGLEPITKNDNDGTDDNSVQAKSQRASRQPRNALGRWVDMLTGVTTDFATPKDQPNGEKQSDLKYLASNGPGTDRRVYRQLKFAGNALTASSLASGNATGAAIGQTARAIGEIGPEAERVLGNGVRRTAYRYRGTERRPDQRLARQIADSAAIAQHLTSAGDLPASLHGRAAALAAEYSSAGTRGGRPGGTPEVVSTPAGVLGHNSRADLSSDQLRMRVAGDIAVDRLRTQVPNLHTASISLAAGKLPPSVGVIIDEDGHLVTEAQGYNGDHYLPFDLRNLKRLQGGQYVRTRTTGGPTDEDLYTALLTGARQVQVVSNSGVFTLELDPSVRGGRRYSDKARQMIGRYAALLSQVGSGKLLASELSPEVRAEARRKALGRAGGNPTSPDLDKYLQEETDKAVAGLAFSELDEGEMEARARQVALDHWKTGHGTGRASFQSAGNVYDDALKEEQQKARAGAARVYRLDGEGYFAAMTALSQEFPFYVRHVGYTPLPEWLAERKLGPSDRPPLSRVADLGYTRRGALEPRRVEASRPRAAEPTATPAAATATAAAAAAGGDAAAATPAVRLEATGFGREFALAMPIFGTRVKGGAEAFGAPGAGATALTEPDALQADPIDWFAWAQANHGGVTGVGRWLLTTAPAGHLDQLKLLLDRVESTSGDAAEMKVPELKAALHSIQIVKAPYADPETDMARAAPNLDNPKPQPFPDAIAAAAGKPEDITAFLANNPDVESAVAALQPLDDAKRAEQIDAGVRRLNDLLLWGEHGGAEEYQTAELAGFDAADAVQAYQDLAAGNQPAPYRSVAATQQAWTLLRAVQVRQLLGPQAGGAAPFVPAAQPPAESTPQQPVAKRNRLVLHGPGSPAAQGLARRARG